MACEQGETKKTEESPKKKVTRIEIVNKTPHGVDIFLFFFFGSGVVV